MKVLAIIPARGGSKGIPLKNIRKLTGLPLIIHTINEAKKSKNIDKIVVSTDDERITKIAKAVSVTSIERPSKLSKDSTPIIDVIKHTLQVLSDTSYVPDVILLLQPTSPLRTNYDIDKTVNVLKRSKATCVLTVSKIKTHPYSSFYLGKKYLKPFRLDFEKFYQRQKYPVLYFPTGSIYAFWHNNIKKYDSLYGPKIKPMMIEQERSVDIDTPFDMFVCEMKLLYWNKFKQKFR